MIRFSAFLPIKDPFLISTPHQVLSVVFFNKRAYIYTAVSVLIYTSIPITQLKRVGQTIYKKDLIAKLLKNPNQNYCVSLINWALNNPA